jgi:hypothetical protein
MVWIESLFLKDLYKTLIQRNNMKPSEKIKQYFGEIERLPFGEEINLPNVRGVMSLDARLILKYLDEEWENENEEFYVDGQRVTRKEYELSLTPASQDNTKE